MNKNEECLDFIKWKFKEAEMDINKDWLYMIILCLLIAGGIAFISANTLVNTNALLSAFAIVLAILGGVLISYLIWLNTKNTKARLLRLRHVVEIKIAQKDNETEDELDFSTEEGE